MHSSGMDHPVKNDVEKQYLFEIYQAPYQQIIRCLFKRLFMFRWQEIPGAVEAEADATALCGALRTSTRKRRLPKRLTYERVDGAGKYRKYRQCNERTECN